MDGSSSRKIGRGLKEGLTDLNLLARSERFELPTLRFEV